LLDVEFNAASVTSPSAAEKASRIHPSLNEEGRKRSRPQPGTQMPKSFPQAQNHSRVSKKTRASPKRPAQPTGLLAHPSERASTTPQTGVTISRAKIDATGQTKVSVPPLFK